MSKAQNAVISGYGSGQKIWNNGTALSFKLGVNLGERVLAKNNKMNSISTYEVLTEDIVKSGSSAILRGATGMALLGQVGILAGLSAKNKAIYTIAIEFKDGKRSLIEIDDALYKVFLLKNF